MIQVVNDPKDLNDLKDLILLKFLKEGGFLQRLLLATLFAAQCGHPFGEASIFEKICRKSL